MNASAPAMTTVDSADDYALQREERAIARKFHGRVPWEMVAWGLGNFCHWPLTFTGILPLWAGFLLSTFCITVCYLPSHEAQHSIIAKKRSRLRWLNELVGHVSTIPLVLPYRIAWITHRQHHAHANDPELDPDYGNKGDTWWQSVWLPARRALASPQRSRRGEGGARRCKGVEVERCGLAQDDREVDGCALLRDCVSRRMRCRGDLVSRDAIHQWQRPAPTG